MGWQTTSVSDRLRSSSKSSSMSTSSHGNWRWKRSVSRPPCVRSLSRAHRIRLSVTSPSCRRLLGPVVGRQLQDRQTWVRSLLFQWGFFRVESYWWLKSHTGDLKTGTPAATLPGAWRYRVRAETGWSRYQYAVTGWDWWTASARMWQRVILRSAAGIHYTSMLLGRRASNKQQPSCRLAE